MVVEYVTVSNSDKQRQGSVRPLVSAGSLLAAVLVFFAALAHGSTSLAMDAVIKPAGPNCLAPSDDASDAYISNAPKNGPLKLYVFGDSLGDGAWSGLARRFKGDDRIQIFRKTKVNSGIVRSDRYDWNRAMQLFARERFHIAVMMFGANDLQSIRAPGRYHHFNTEGWQERYKDRIDRLIEPLKKNKVAIYWIGLPIVGKANFARDYKIVNAIFREKMEEHGVKFIDAYSAFALNGKFSMYGPDVNGKTTLLRHTDRVHFSIPGNVKLASLAEKEIRSDMAAVTPCPNKAENQN